MRITILISLLLGACFNETIDGGDGDDDDEGTTGDTDSAGTEGPGSATAASGSGSASSTSLTTTNPTSPSTSSDESGPTDTGVPECGNLGADCCAGEACNEGACFDGRCVVFAGMYGEPETCPGGTCTTEHTGKNGMMDIPPPYIPFLGACECPPGFEAAPGMPATSDYCPIPDLLHTNTFVRFCQSMDLYENSDWTGAYATTDEAECMTEGNTCMVGNPYAMGECACPLGEEEFVARTVHQCNGDGEGNHFVDIHICLRPEVEPITFGGAFQWAWGMPNDCHGPNPLANDECDCPVGFVGQPLRMTSAETGFGGDLFVCVPN